MDVTPVTQVPITPCGLNKPPNTSKGISTYRCTAVVCNQSILLLDGLSYRTEEYCYIIAEGLFILSFFVGYILYFGLVRLSTIRLSARVWAHIECRCSRSLGEDVTITDIIIKTPDRKWKTEVWMTSCPESMGWGFWVIFEKKQWVEIRTWAKRANFWASARPGQLGLRDAPRVVWSEGTVSIIKIVSLPPRVENLKVKKVIKISYRIYQPLCSGRIWHKVNFWAEFNRFEFRVFLLLD